MAKVAMDADVAVDLKHVYKSLLLPRVIEEKMLRLIGYTCGDVIPHQFCPTEPLPQTESSG